MDDEAAINLLTELVSIPSPSGEEAAASRYLAGSLNRMGFVDVEIDESGSAVGQRRSAEQKASTLIVLLGHIDTVPGWIEPRRDGDKFFGRGSVDAKGPLAAMTIAAARARLRPGVRLVLIGAVEEESASSKGARLAATRFQPDFCVIGEPSGWDGYTLGYKGRLLIDYSGQLPEGHWAGPRIAAGETAIEWWNRLKTYLGERNSDKQRVFDQVQMVLRKFQTNSDGIHDRAELQVGLRLPIDFDRDDFESRARSLAGSAELRFHAFEQAWQTPRTCRLANLFAEAIRSSQGTPRAKLKTGTSDMNVVGPIWRCPIIAYGPGDSSLDHTPNEHISISEFLRAIEVLQRVLESIG